MELVQIRCHECHTYFCICRKCYRGQAYCCERCKSEAARRNHRRAQQKYQQTQNGKQKHREAEKRRRLRQWDKKRGYPLYCVKTMAARQPQRQGGQKMDFKARKIKKKLGQKGYCYFCGIEGRIIEKFHRRGYGTQ